MKWIIQIGLAALAAVAVVIAVMWVLQLGPFNHRPSAAVKIIPKVQAAVVKTQAVENKAVEKAEVKAKAAAPAIEKRTAKGVDQIRKSTAGAAPGDVPDLEFYRGVCASKLYSGTSDCRSYGGRP